MEVYGGLQLWSVSRLSKIYKLPKKFTTMINEIEEFASPKDNSAYLRKHISYNLKLGIPTIPYVGLMLKDLTFIEDGNLDFVKDNLVNIDKISMIGIKLKELDGFQKMPYHKQITYKITKLLDILSKCPGLMSEEELTANSERFRPLKSLETHNSSENLSSILSGDSEDSETSSEDSIELSSIATTISSSSQELTTLKFVPSDTTL